MTRGRISAAEEPREPIVVDKTNRAVDFSAKGPCVYKFRRRDDLLRRSRKVNTYFIRSRKENALVWLVAFPFRFKTSTTHTDRTILGVVPATVRAIQFHHFDIRSPLEFFEIGSG